MGGLVSGVDEVKYGWVSEWGGRGEVWVDEG